jgi:hypothetical protein
MLVALPGELALQKQMIAVNTFIFVDLIMAIIHF